MIKGLDALERMETLTLRHKSQKYDIELDIKGVFKEEFETIKKELKALEFIKKCFYVAKSSSAILRTSYGFEHEEELREVLL